MPPTEEDIAWLKSTFHPIPRPALPDDCIEYSLFISSNTLDPSNDSETRLRLKEVQKYATSLQKTWLKDYIWQRQGFMLELQKEDGVSLLRGRTEYGDSIEDEWVIVWLLREISKQFNDLWIKVTDTDGEFLLIEASGTLPAWLEPEIAENRVWINQGQLKIIKRARDTRSSRLTEEKLTLAEARQMQMEKSQRIMHSTSIEEESFYRLRNYPDQIKSNMHHALVTIPRKIAFLLKTKPSYIAPAVEAFYLRDPIALKPLNSKTAVGTMNFPPKDPVNISVKFPKVAYAQLRSQEFPAPAVFADSLAPNLDATSHARADTGMKITCGFEMLLTDPQHQDRPSVREIKLLLEDLDSGDESLPSDAEIEGWEKRQDDEAWLDIDFNDLERELDKNKSTTSKKREFGDKAAQENLQRIVKQFEDFLNDDKAGPDGAGLFEENSEDDLDEDDLDISSEENDDGEDKDVSFDEDEFSRMMQEMMGMPPNVMHEIMHGKLGAGAGSKSTDQRDQAGRSSGRIQEIHDNGSDDEEADTDAAIEAELREHGVLDLDLKASGVPAIMDRTGDHELAEDNINVNLVKNLLESFKAQAGTSGPGGNLMSAMGVRFPRDDGDNDSAAGPSTKP